MKDFKLKKLKFSHSDTMLILRPDVYTPKNVNVFATVITIHSIQTNFLAVHVKTQRPYLFISILKP